MVLILLAALTSRGGPPFTTDDPEPVEYQHWEFYLASQDFKTAAGRTGTGPHAEVNYGVVPNVQLHVIAPLAYSTPSAGGSAYGYGDTELGMKIRFVEETNWLPQIGIFPLLEVPTGSAGRGLGNGRPQGFLPLWLQKSIGEWTVYGGGGYGINSGTGNRDWNFVGAVVQNQVRTNLLLGAEVYRQSAEQAGGRDNLAFNLGAVFDFSPSQHLLLSAGRSLDGPVDFQVYLAYQFTFDNSLFHLWNRPRH